MRIALAQLNPLIGDLTGNAAKILDASKKANAQKANLLITPELSIWGYPPRDLLLNPLLLMKQKETLDQLVNTIKKETPELALLVGIAEMAPDGQLPNLFNSLALVQSQGWKVVARKQLLPTYDVFDEKRYFRSASNTSILQLNLDGKSWSIGLTICEDLWVEKQLQTHRTIGIDPLKELAENKIDLLLNISASPFSHRKEFLRQQLAIKASQRLCCPVIYMNQVGGNDELIFDGASFVINPLGELELQLPRCQESVAIWEPNSNYKAISESKISSQEILLNALVLGLRDYATKCGFSSVLIGLSGGIDSALVAVIASAALGPKKVSAILMPSPWSSTSSVKDAEALANRLGIQKNIIPIKPLMDSYDCVLKDPLGGNPKGLTAENLQARIRGTLLMALANDQRRLLLSTGNKSELAVGYCTLYGDMNGGLSVIGDLYKTSVFKLCEWLDSKDSLNCRSSLNLPLEGELIGNEIRNKPPSAELRPDQLDSDSLPKYEVLDPILKGLIEDRSGSKELIEKGFDPLIVNKIERLFKQSEFKRRQAPPLLKVSNQAFGTGWRVPIAAT